MQHKVILIAPMAESTVLSQPAEVAAENPVLPTQEQQAAPAAIREDQIANAVAFLTHPKVRESPTATKRSFLERKGLTAAEIDEAFRRVPEPTTSTATPLSVPSQNAATGLITYQPLQQGATSHATMPASSAATTSSLQVVPARPGVQQQMVPLQQQQQLAQPAPPEPIRWSQVMLGVGVVAAAVYAVKTLVVPPAQEWYRQWCEKSKAQREVQERQQAALLEAVESLKACQAELKVGSEAMQEMAKAFREQQVQQAAALALERGRDTLSAQELRTELSTLRALVLSSTHTKPQVPPSRHQPDDSVYDSRDTWGPVAQGRSSKVPLPPWQQTASSNLGAGSGIASGTGRGVNGLSTTNGGHTNGHTGGYTSYSSMVDTYPPDVLPPPRGYLGGWGSSNGPLAGGSAAGSGTGTPAYGRASPALGPSVSGSAYADGRGRTGSTNLPSLPQSLAGEELRPGTGAVQGLGEGSETAGGSAAAGGTGSDGPEKAPYPPSFHEVMEMVAKGITPPNVRTDIKDTPPDPSRPPSQSLLTPRPKPWDVRPSSASPPTNTTFGQQPSTTQGGDSAQQSGPSTYANGSTWAAPLAGGVAGWSIHNSSSGVSGMNGASSSAAQQHDSGQQGSDVPGGMAPANGQTQGADNTYPGNGNGIISNMNSSNTPFSSASAAYQSPSDTALPTPAYHQHSLSSASASSSQHQSSVQQPPWATAASSSTNQGPNMPAGSSSSQAGLQGLAAPPTSSASAPPQSGAGGSSLISNLVKSSGGAGGWKPPPPPMPTLTKDSSSFSPSRQPATGASSVGASANTSSKAGFSEPGAASGMSDNAPTSTPPLVTPTQALLPEPASTPALPSHAHTTAQEEQGPIKLSLVPDDGDSQQLRAGVVVAEPEDA